MEPAQQIIRCILRTNLYVLESDDIIAIGLACKSFQKLLSEEIPYRFNRIDMILFQQMSLAINYGNGNPFVEDFMNGEECDSEIIERAIQLFGSPVECDTHVHIIASAIMEQNYEKVKLLVPHVKQINTHYCDDSTYLYDAAETNNIQIMQLLIDNGANVNDKTYEGEVYLFEKLYYCCDGIKSSTLSFLVKNGASCVLSNGTTILLQEEEHPQIEEIVTEI